MLVSFPDLLLPTGGLGTRQPCCCDIVPRRPPMAELQQDADLFKEEFKRYKRRAPPVDLSSVVDPRYPERFTGEASLGDAFQLSFHPILHPLQLSVITCCQAGEDSNVRASLLGLNPPRQWQIYQLSSVPGYILKFRF